MSQHMLTVVPRRKSNGIFAYVINFINSNESIAPYNSILTKWLGIEPIWYDLFQTHVQ